MRVYTYIQEALTPGGTVKRLKEWLASMMLVHLIFCFLPALIERPYPLWMAAVLIFLGLFSIAAFFIRQPVLEKLLLYFFPLMGYILCVGSIILNISNLGQIIYVLAWSMCVLIAERREYFSYRDLLIYLGFIMVALTLPAVFAPSHQGNLLEKILVVGSGCILSGINGYLLYIDFEYDKNYYRESREMFANTGILSKELSEILTRDESLESLLWTVSQTCIPLLKLEDCVIYLYDEERNRLRQVAAYGNKTSNGEKIVQPLEVEPGKGVVGTCFERQEALLVLETKYFPGYIVDDQARDSELAVPIFSNGKVIGVLDSEHSQKGYFKERHLQAFQVIASFCGIKITEHYARESMKAAQLAHEEAERYKELDELKNRFITNISHDLKTPLSLIKAPAIQLSLMADSDHVKKLSFYIIKNTEHLLRVVDQLLQLNRVDHGLNQLYVEETTASQMIEKVRMQYEGLAQQRQVEFTATADAITLVTDTFRLEQILHNLIHNAFRYTPSGGRIEARIIRNHDRAQITVSDNGPGIPKELHQKIFERFYKADVNNHEGTGIGLSLVKEYAEVLEGTVALQSQPGEGTRFIIDLPLVHSSAANAQHTAAVAGFEEAENAETKPVMLVVEDHVDLNNFICNYFEQEFHCVAAFDGAEAMKKMQSITPDIVITDLMMPHTDGEALVAAIKNNDRTGHIPVIVLSAKAQLQSKIDLYTTGADNYLLKPFDILELKAVVQSTLEQRKKLRHLFQLNFLQPSVSLDVTEIPEQDEPVSPIIRAAMDFVMKHLDNEEIGVNDMAASLGMGRNKLQRELKNLTGLTPVEFIRSIRLHEARRLLTDPRMNVSEVAYATGFNNLSYFSRSFKAEFDLLPSEWREQHLHQA